MSARATPLSLKGTLTLIRELVLALRVHQWVKNLLVFVAPLLGGALFAQQSFLRAALVFLAFCAAASGTYLINDLLDLKSDREHPRKRNRPFASGRLHLAFAALGPILLVVGFGIALYVSGPTASIVAGYIVLSLSYSLFLKKRPLVDVFRIEPAVHGTHLCRPGGARRRTVQLARDVFRLPVPVAGDPEAGLGIPGDRQIKDHL
jgi:4-hydroxybenzoate polyprenyltransferase